jgi:hypothetical protein
MKKSTKRGQFDKLEHEKSKVFLAEKKRLFQPI